MVLSDRIGSANFFWSFPSKAYQDQVSTRGTLLERIQLTEKSVANIEEEINVAKRSRCAADRGSKLKALEDLASRERALDQQLEVFRFNDPAEIQKIDDQADASRGAANRWTDNIYVLRSFLVKKKGMGSKEVRMMELSMYSSLCICCQHSNALLIGCVDLLGGWTAENQRRLRLRLLNSLRIYAIQIFLYIFVSL